jgi:predicted lipoprotein with Yx(FWY)xxD motif
MMRTRSIVLAAAVAGAAMTLAACSNSSSGGAYGAAGSTSTSTVVAGTAATVATADVGQLGTVLVDGSGRTLYLFTNDTGTSSTCSGDCAATWPALTTKGDAAVGTGAKSSMLGTTTRDDGTTQVTYAGHPLYLYSGDKAAGDSNGEGVGDIWFAVTVQGTPAQASAGGSSSSMGGYGSPTSSGGYGHA